MDLPRILSAAAQSVASNPRAEPFCEEFLLVTRGIEKMIPKCGGSDKVRTAVHGNCHFHDAVNTVYFVNTLASEMLG